MNRPAMGEECYHSRKRVQTCCLVQRLKEPEVAGVTLVTQTPAETQLSAPQKEQSSKCCRQLQDLLPPRRSGLWQLHWSSLFSLSVRI